MPLTDTEYGELRNATWRDAVTKAQLKALPALPNRVTLTAIFQAIDDFWEANRATLKADMDAAAGATIPNPLAKALGKIWLLWKFKRGG
jgi:hypothetical protein